MQISVNCVDSCFGLKQVISLKQNLDKTMTTTMEGKWEFENETVYSLCSARGL